MCFNFLADVHKDILLEETLNSFYQSFNISSGFLDHFLEDSSEFSKIENDSSESFGNASGSLKDIDSIKSSYNNKTITKDFLEKVVDGFPKQ